MFETKPITVWLLSETDYDGRAVSMIGIFTSEEEAAPHMGTFTSLIERRAIVADWETRSTPKSFYLLDQFVNISIPANINLPKTSKERKAAALAKLTDEDKAILGL